MRVLLLSEDGNPSWVGLRAALERTSTVSHVDISGVERSADADILIATDVTAAEIIARRLRPATWLLVVVAGPAPPGERIKLLDQGADLVLHGAVPDDEIVAQVGQSPAVLSLPHTKPCARAPTPRSCSIPTVATP